MNKIVLFLLFCCVMQTRIIAQTKAPKGFKVNVGVLMAIPASNLKYSTVGAGLDVQAQYGFCNAFVATSSLGYTGLAGEGFYPYTAAIPITVGLRYYPIAKLYAAGKLGWGVYTLSTTKINYTAYALGAAYEISKKWDTGVYYDGFINSKTSFGYVALRFGYTF